MSSIYKYYFRSRGKKCLYDVCIYLCNMHAILEREFITPIFQHFQQGNKSSAGYVYVLDTKKVYIDQK